MGHPGGDAEELAAIWREFEPLTVARIQAIRDALRGSVGAAKGSPARETARVEAHTIAGSAAIFGRREAAVLAREIEEVLERAEALTAEDVARIGSLADRLVAALSA